MRYKVEHNEKYFPYSSVSIYDSLDDFRERYRVYYDDIENELKGIKLGETAEIWYDQYVDLKVSGIC